MPYTYETTINSLLTDTLVSGQLYLRMPFQTVSVLSSSQTLYLHIPVNGHSRPSLSRKRTRTLFLFTLSRKRTPMYNKELRQLRGRRQRERH